MIGRKKISKLASIIILSGAVYFKDILGEVTYTIADSFNTDNFITRMYNELAYDKE